MRFTSLFRINVQNVWAFMKSHNVQRFVLWIVVCLMKIMWSRMKNSWPNKHFYTRSKSIVRQKKRELVILGTYYTIVFPYFKYVKQNFKHKLYVNLRQV